jgi:hypothetical protein
MDAAGNPEKDAKGSSEDASPDTDVSWKADAAGDMPTVESPQLVPEPGDHKEEVGPAAATAPVTALVLAGHRFDRQAHEGAADKARARFAAFTGQLRDLHLPKIPPLAATVMLAACIGAVAGSLGTFAVSVALAPSQAQQVAEARVLKDTITRLSADLAGVRAASEASLKASSGQLARMAERLDKAEKQQRLAMAPPAPVPPATIPAARSPLAANSAAPSTEVTGSIPSPRPAPLGFNKDNSRPVISGWVLQNVYDGTAYIQSREGAMEVMVGDLLPDGGRVESIRRMNGRWVVVTTNGLVVMR